MADSVKGVAPITSLSSRRRQSESDLVTAVVSGDHKAFSDVYSQNADYTFGLIGRLVGPVSERDDLLQDVFIKLHRALPRFRGDCSLRTFISRIAVNCCHDHLRRRGRKREDLFADPGEWPGAWVDGEKNAIVADEYATVLRCLDRIKPKKRVAFVLRVACGMSYGEMAELLDVKPDTARARVGHARIELAAMLAKEGIDG